MLQASLAHHQLLQKDTNPMTEDLFDLNNKINQGGTLSSTTTTSTSGSAEFKDPSSAVGALDSITYGVASSLLQGNAAAPPCGWPQDSAVALLQQTTQRQQQRRNSLASLGDSNIMSFPNPRRDSLGLGGLGGSDLGSFAAGVGSRRSSLALGLDLSNLGDPQLSSADVAALTSQSLGGGVSQSLLNSGLGATATPSTNAQQLSALQTGGDLSSLQQQQQQLLLQQQCQQEQRRQQHQQQPNMRIVDQALEAKRVQAEAQAAAAALFLGAPLPGNDDSPTANNLGQLGGRPDSLAVAGTPSSAPSSQQLLGGAGLSALPNPTPNVLQNSQQLLLQRHSAAANSRDVLQGMGLNLGGGTSGNATSGGSLTDNSLTPLTSFSQLQQLQLQQQQQQKQQQQQQLQLLQSSLVGGAATTQTPQQQLQQKQLQQLQFQHQMRQQDMRRHSLSLSLPFDSMNSPQQQQQQQQLKLKDMSLTEQLRLHQQQLDNLVGGEQDLLGASTAIGMKRGQLLASPRLPKKKPKLGVGKPSSSTGSSSSDLQNPTTTPSSKGANSNKKDASFPLKLHEILSNPDYHEMIAWMPHGKSWRILKPSAFENIVIPLHFRHSKYASFMRQVNGWGFQRVLHGNDHNSYKHDMFVRDKPELCKKMKRVGTVKNIIKEAAAVAEATAESDQITSASNDISSGQPGAEKKNDDAKKASLESGGGGGGGGGKSLQSIPGLSKMTTINVNLTNPPSPHAIENLTSLRGGNDVTSISAARSVLSNKFAASIGNIGRTNVTLNQANSGLDQLFQETSSSLDTSSMGLGQLGGQQQQQMQNLTASLLGVSSNQQQQQSLSSFLSSGEGLDSLQQQLSLGASNAFSQQQQQQQQSTLSSLSKSGLLSSSGAAPSGGSSLLSGNSSNPLNAAPFDASLAVASAAAGSSSGPRNENHDVEI